MQDLFSVEEQAVLQLLKEALSPQKSNKKFDFMDADEQKILSIARKHAILPLLNDIVQELHLFTESQMDVVKETRRIVLQSYRLLFLTKYVVELLNSKGIKVVVLKGVATAGFYPVPELRKSGDIDLLLPEEIEEKKLIEIMLEAGFQMEKEQYVNHHIVFVSKEGISIELHGMLAEPFAYKRINQAMERQMKECNAHIQNADVMGMELPILDKPYHAYELLLHMLQHFMYAGFGLKLLCDWLLIWRRDWLEEEVEVFKRLVKESGLEKFAKVITEVCVKYLGMNSNVFAWPVSVTFVADEMMREILDSEEFGNADENRMVMMSGTGIGAYVKEFQHQMHLNFPKAGKCFLLWPILWVMTMIQFLENNRKVRNTSVRKILEEANRRSALMDRLKLLK